MADNGDDIAVSEFQAQINQAMENAGAQIVAQRREKESNVEAQHRTQILQAFMRAQTTIRNIPRLIEQATKNTLSRGQRYGSGGYDCWVEVMRLEELESAEKANVPNPMYWYHHMPNPNKLLYAARLVFDFCERAGQNVIVSRRIQEGATGGYFCIELYWNIPPELWKLTKPRLEFESTVPE